MPLIAVAISLIEMSSVRRSWLSHHIKTHSTSLDTPFMLIQRGLNAADTSTAKYTPEKQKLLAWCCARGVFASPRVCAEPDAAN